MGKKPFLKHAAVYALGDLLVMAGGMVLLPIYARRLTLAEFGLLEVLERLAEVAAICLLARGIPLATFTHYKQGADDDARRRAVGAGLLLAVAAALAGAAVAAATARPLARLLEIERPLLLWMAVLAALIDGVAVVVQATNQARLESGFFVTVSFAQFVVKVALCVLFVVGFGWGVWGVVLASLGRSTLFAAALVFGEWRRGLLWPDGKTVREMVAFVLPFLPTGLCFFVLNSGDRFFLVRQGGPGEVGIYGLGYRLALLVGLFSLTPLYRVWSSRLYEVAETPDAARVFGQMVSRILGAYLLVGLALCLFQDEVIRVFAGNAFQGAASVIAPVVLAYWFQGASVLMEAGFYLRRQTRWKPLIALASTVVMLLLYAILIPRQGAVGAALATLGGFVFHAMLTWAISQRLFPVRYEYGRLLGMLGLAVGVWLLAGLGSVGQSAFLVRAALYALWPILLLATGLIAPEEIRFIRELGKRFLASGRFERRQRETRPENIL